MPKPSAVPSVAAALVAVVLVALVACGPVVSSATPPRTPSSPVVSPAATGSPAVPSPPASPATTPARPSGAEIPFGSALEPGRYTRSAFVPRITFEVGAGWRAVQVLDGFFDIQRDPGSPDVIAVQFARPTAFYGATGARVEASTATAAAATIAANPALTILDSSASKLSGLDGFVVEVENPPTASDPAEVLDVPPGALAIDPGRRLWVAVFDTPEGIVAILVGGSVAKWDAALAAAEPVLETVTIGQ